jgi:integrase
MRKRLNDRFIRTRPRQPKKRIDFYDTEISALCLRVNPNGERTWTYRYTFRGQRPRATLGHHPSSHSHGVGPCHRCLTVTEARNEAIKIDALIARGIDPREAENEPGLRLVMTTPRNSPHGPKVEEVAESLLERKKELKSVGEIERILRRDVLPAPTEDGRAFSELGIGEVRPRHLRQVLDPIVKRARETARKARKNMYQLFELAREVELIEVNPVSALSPLGKQTSRTRYLRDWEIQKVWEVWSRPEYDPVATSVHKLALLTLARPGEILRMRWDQVRPDEEGGLTWQIPQTKNDVEHTVYLPPFAAGILRDLEKLRSSRPDWVFPGPNPNRPRQGVKGAKANYEKESMKLGLDPWQLRDLRATGATGMSRLGIDEKVIAVCQNHKPNNITARVYIRHKTRMWAQARDAWRLWAEHVESVVRGEEAELPAAEVA